MKVKDFSDFLDASTRRRCLWPEHECMLLLIRHAQPIPRAERKPETLLDPPLTDVGVNQAECLGRRFKSTKVDLIVSSPMLRARQTAERLKQLCKASFEEDNDVRELEIDSVAATRVFRRPRNMRMAMIEKFARSGQWSDLEIFETTTSIASRINSFVTTTLQRKARVVVVVSHGAFINAALAQAAQSAADYFVSLVHTSVSTLLIAQGRLVVWSVNDHSHLPSSLVSV